MAADDHRSGKPSPWSRHLSVDRLEAQLALTVQVVDNRRIGLQLDATDAHTSKCAQGLLVAGPEVVLHCLPIVGERRGGAGTPNIYRHASHPGFDRTHWSKQSVCPRR